MNFARFLSPDSIDLNMDLSAYEDPDDEDFKANEVMKNRKEGVLDHIAQLLFASGKVNNLNKLRNFLILNEGKASSAVGEGIALPHVRCMQTRTLVLCFGRYSPGLDFDAPDDEKVKLFIGMIAPPYDDKLYLRMYRAIATSFLETDVKEELLSMEHTGEIIRTFNQYFI